jgi:hypothetical protein
MVSETTRIQLLAIFDKRFERIGFRGVCRCIDLIDCNHLKKAVAGFN